jgi:hypothetical protein
MRFLLLPCALGIRIRCFTTVLCYGALLWCFAIVHYAQLFTEALLALASRTPPASRELRTPLVSREI